jgi:hypothetical protein
MVVAEEAIPAGDIQEGDTLEVAAIPVVVTLVEAIQAVAVIRVVVTPGAEVIPGAAVTPADPTTATGVPGTMKRCRN